MEIGREIGGTRATLLDAASRVALREGVGKLTLDAVSREARVSKGGLLYHFPNKDALVRGLIEDLLFEFDRGLEDRLGPGGGSASKDFTEGFIEGAASTLNRKESEEGEPGSWLRAYVGTTLGESPGSGDYVALLAAVATNPGLLDPVRERFAAWQERAEEDGLDPALATAIRLAADGLAFAHLFGLAPPDEALQKDVGEVLVALTRQTTPGAEPGVLGAQEGRA